MQKTKECLNCKQTIIKRQNESLKDWETRHKFCTRICAAKYRDFGLKTRFSVERNYVPPTAIKKGQQLSPKTQFKKGLAPWNQNKKGVMPDPWNKGKRFDAIRGDKHPNWKGGRTTLNQNIRVLPEMKKWIREIMERDNFTCQWCEARCSKGKSIYLEVHHIKPFSLILKEYSITSIEQSLQCDEMWSKDNGITLCKKCHYKTRFKNFKS